MRQQNIGWSAKQIPEQPNFRQNFYVCANFSAYQIAIEISYFKSTHKTIKTFDNKEKTGKGNSECRIEYLWSEIEKKTVNFICLH